MEVNGMTETSAAIQFHDVCYTVDDTSILEHIAGHFPEGRITTIVGPSVSGKKTLIKLCNELLSSNTEKIKIKEKRIDANNPVELGRTVSISLKSAVMLPGNVQKNLAQPLELK